MDPAIFSTAARRTRLAHQSAVPRRDPTIRQLRRNLRRVRLKITQRYHALHEYARIYRALAAREAEESERKFMLLRLAEEADERVERVEIVTAKVSGCTQSPSGNVVPSPDPLVSTALAD